MYLASELFSHYQTVALLQMTKIFHRSANGKFDATDYAVLKTRSMYNMSEEEKEEIYKKSVMLCAKNADLKRFNLKRIKELKGPKAIVASINNNWQAKAANTSKAGEKLRI